MVYAQAECDETLIHLEFLFETGSFKDAEKINDLGRDYDDLSKKINKFTQWVDKSFKTKTSSNDELAIQKTGNRKLATGNSAAGTSGPEDELNDYTL